jgi:two-component system, OmpR family, phosphate regulon sensor histidine kinase PhoR
LCLHSLISATLNRNTIRIIIILGIVAISGIIAIQAYWVKRAFDLEGQRFRQTAMIALKDVAKDISKVYQLSEIDNPVEQLASDYYVVNLRTPLDAAVLEHYLKTTFKKYDLNTDFEYGIYDCDTDKIRYGNFVNKDFEVESTEVSSFEKTDKFLNYFGVRFPKRERFHTQKMDFWMISSLITLIVTAFFGYAMFIILKQKRLSEVQRDFVNNMTHEFQTPISTIRVATDVLRQPKIMEQPERLAKYVQIIRQENTRLKNQVESVLTTAKVSRGKLELDLQLQELHSLIEEVLEVVKIELGDNLNIEYKAVKTSFYGDRVHIMNVIRNLVENAIKYSEPPAQIHVKTENTDKGIEVTIADKGIGIPVEHIKKIFNKFYRVPTGNLHNVKGFGLGLNFVEQIVKAHKWQISVESEYGKGTTFTIIIPQNEG